MSKTEEPLFEMPLYYNAGGEMQEGKILIFEDYLEIRKIIKPNKKIVWDDVVDVKATHREFESAKFKEHKGMATAANLLNALDYALNGTSIGYAYQGGIESIPYIADYSEKIVISVLESGEQKNYTFDYQMKDDIGDQQFTKEIQNRIKDVEDFNRIVKEVIEKNKKNNFNNWYNENVKTDFKE